MKIEEVPCGGCRLLLACCVYIIHQAEVNNIILGSESSNVM
jgi:hypothetical protein